MNPITEMRPWGSFERLTLNETSTVKLISVGKNKRLSLQYHQRRKEFWKVLSGSILVQVDGMKTILRAGDSITVPAMAVHRIEGLEDSKILEVSIGHFAEDDIVRLEDDYLRAVPIPARRKQETAEQRSRK